MSICQHDFTIERRFPQSPQQTFQAFADSDLRQRWFRVPDSWTDTEWRFHDMVDGERIVFAYDMLLDGLIFTEHGAFLDDLDDPAEREHGTGLLLDRLEVLLADGVTV